MRDIEVYVEPHEVRRRVDALWRTDALRTAAATPGHPVHGVVERFARVPRFFYAMDVPDVERCHFTPWFGAIGHREYANDALHDLFYLHEMVHMGSLEYDPGASFEAWAGKMAMNEVRASVWSEALVHVHVPGLRAPAFDREIWVDRFLRRDPPPSEADLLAERWRASAFPTDPIEERIALFQEENRRWAEVWRERRRDVESAMLRLVRASQNGAAARARAAEAHREWLLARMTDGARPYPFPDEADAFAGVYWSTRTPAAALA